MVRGELCATLCPGACDVVGPTLQTPPGLGSWGLFDCLLTEAHVVGTPGVGFGPSGERYFRFTAFGRRDQTEEAVDRIRARLRRYQTRGQAPSLASRPFGATGINVRA